MDHHHHHTCIFKQLDPKQSNQYRCIICSDTHVCTSEVCDSLQFNRDYTNVCTKTGICYEQKMCDEFYDPNRATTSTFDSNTNTRRIQSLSIRIMTPEDIRSILDQSGFSEILSNDFMEQFIQQLLVVWKNGVGSSHVKLKRKDKRCFVISILFNLHKGIETQTGVVVHKHEELNPPLLNKRFQRQYPVDITDIRYGELLIRKLFATRACENPIYIKTKIQN